MVLICSVFALTFLIWLVLVTWVYFSNGIVVISPGVNSCFCRMYVLDIWVFVVLCVSGLEFGWVFVFADVGLLQCMLLRCYMYMVGVCMVIVWCGLLEACIARVIIAILLYRNLGYIIDRTLCGDCIFGLLDVGVARVIIATLLYRNLRCNR